MPNQTLPEYRAAWVAADGSNAAGDASLMLEYAQREAADHRGVVEVNYGHGWSTYAPTAASVVPPVAPEAAPETDGPVAPA